jgi:hypothetical protein
VFDNPENSFVNFVCHGERLVALMEKGSNMPIREHELKPGVPNQGNKLQVSEKLSGQSR